jgi:hypothetical protein
LTLYSLLIESAYQLYTSPKQCRIIRRNYNSMATLLSRLSRLPFRIGRVATLPVAVITLFSLVYTLAAQTPQAESISGVESDNAVYLPLVSKPSLPELTLTVPIRTSSNLWTVSWSGAEQTPITGYDLEQSTTADFSNAGLISLPASTTSFTTAQPSLLEPIYYYRVRVRNGPDVGNWSATHSIHAPYRDNFDNPGSGWAIRRQDTDDINNSYWYGNNEFVLKIGGRWDYAIAAPMVPAPAAPYRMETRVRLHQPGNLHAYGLIFGGDWNGETCPDAQYSSCFNQYYRLLIIWYGSPDTLRIQLKRIDYHDPKDNSGGGETLVPFRDVYVGPDPGGWRLWRVDVLEDGQMHFYVNDVLVAAATDTAYLHNPYFGLFAASNEYLGTQPHLDWFQVTPLP